MSRLTLPTLTSMLLQGREARVVWARICGRPRGGGGVGISRGNDRAAGLDSDGRADGILGPEVRRKVLNKDSPFIVDHARTTVHRSALSLGGATCRGRS